MPHQVDRRRDSFPDAGEEGEIRERGRGQVGHHLLQQQFESLIVPDLLDLGPLAGQSVIQCEIALNRADSDDVVEPIGEPESDRFQHIADGGVVWLEVEF